MTGCLAVSAGYAHLVQATHTLEAALACQRLTGDNVDRYLILYGGPVNREGHIHGLSGEKTCRRWGMNLCRATLTLYSYVVQCVTCIAGVLACVGHILYNGNGNVNDNNYLSIYLYIYLSIDLSIHPSISPSLPPSLPLSLSLSLPACLSVCLSVCLSIYLFD